ncbi:MAG TPA: helix-turn-helix domain-containing protein [Solirubrobacteraceae bacterium]|nr:helix-turn-helix domain-containing protein [Solirubrobacteraceae bacterium]
MSAAPGAAVLAMRCDAQRNRQALLEAAAAAFGEGGIDVSAGEIARRAGVAKGTLFRHFPAKRDLLGAVLAHRMRALEELIAEVSRERPPGLGAVAELMSRGAEMLAADRSFFDAAMRDAAGESQLVGVKLELMAALDRLVADAQACGEVRTDVAGIDLAMLMMAATNTCAPAQGRDPELWRRYLALMIDGLRPEAASVLPVPALSAAQLRELSAAATGRAVP